MIGLLLTGAAAAMGATYGLRYHSMATRSQLFGRTFTGSGCGPHQLALTYDDGPNDPHTLKLLEVLDRHGAKATFFMVGRYVEAKPQIAQAVARGGHAIGNHTFTHPNLIFCSPTQIRLQLEECERALTDVVGEHSRLFRPPYGARRPKVLQIAREIGLIPTLWNITGHDWDAGSSARIETRVAGQVQKGGVILLHDGDCLAMGSDRSCTVAATDQIIRRYRDQGFKFVTVPEMMAERGDAGRQKSGVRSRE